MTNKEKYVTRIRRFLKDTIAKNQLIDGLESEDEDIEEAIDSVYDHFVIAPPVRLDVPFEDATKHLWFRWGVLAFLLDSEAIMNIRNELPYSDGGVNINENAKSGPYTQLALNYWQKFDAGLRDLKLKHNLESFPWGGTGWYEDSYLGMGQNRPII